MVVSEKTFESVEVSAMMSRRHFLTWCGNIGLALGLSSLFPGLAKASEHPDGSHAPANYPQKLADAEFIQQLITQNAAASRVIMWQSKKRMDAVRLEYRAKDSKDAAWEDVSYQYLAQQGHGIFFYACRLSGLLPQTSYEFRIVNGRRATDWQNILPTHYDGFQMLIFADSQCEYYDAWRSLTDAACKRHPEAELATVIGDLTDNGQFYYHWQGWYQGAEPLLRSHIFIPVMGNHECYDPNWQMCLPEGYLCRFIHPDNHSSRFPGYYYSFDYGPVHFIVLNNQFEELDGLRPGLLEEQRMWFRHDVEQSKTPWKVVLMHKDVISYEYPDPVKGDIYINEIGDIFMPDFEACGIDLVLTGHLHVYRNRRHIFRGKPSKNGPVYVLCGFSGDQRYHVPISPEFDKVTAPQPEDSSYLTLDATARELRLRCYLKDGTLIDDMKLTGSQKEE